MAANQIGVDFGHCNTTASMPRRIATPRNSEGTYQVIPLQIADRKDVIDTQIILSIEQMKMLKGKEKPSYNELMALERKTGKIKIGSNLTATEDEELFMYFKVPPKYFNEPCGETRISKEIGITHGQLMACFIYAVVNGIYLWDAQVNFEREDLKLLVGCPSTSDWTMEEQRNKYADLVAKATGIAEVEIIPESRAAMFSSIEGGRNTISAAEGAAVFDFGSSTADFTYMRLGKACKEISWALGASSVEKEMVKEFKRQAGKEFVQMHPDTEEIDFENIQETMNNARRQKEEYYSNPHGMHSLVARLKYKKRRAADWIVDKGGKMQSVDSEFMDTITSKKEISCCCDSALGQVSGTWENLCKQFMESAKEKIDNQPLKVIILTGGASRMYFIEKICKKVFPDAVLHKEENPTHTVSKGLAWVALSDAKFDECKQHIVENLKTKCPISQLIGDMEDNVWKKVKKSVKMTAEQWAGGQANRSLSDLKSAIGTQMNEETFKDELRTKCNDSVTNWKSIFAKESVKATNMEIAQLYTQELADGLMMPENFFQDMRTDKIVFSFKAINSVVSNCTKLNWLTNIIAAIRDNGLLQAILVVICRFMGIQPSETAPIGPVQRNRMAQQLIRQLDSRRSDILEDFRRSLRQLETAYPQQLEETVQFVLEIATLKRFDL